MFEPRIARIGSDASGLRFVISVHRCPSVVKKPFLGCFVAPAHLAMTGRGLLFAPFASIRGQKKNSADRSGGWLSSTTAIILRRPLRRLGTAALQLCGGRHV